MAICPGMPMGTTRPISRDGRLHDNDGRLTWHYYLQLDEENEKWPQTTCDKYHLGLPTGLPELPKPNTLARQLRMGCLSSPNSRCPQVIGHVSMGVQCFFSQESSLPGMSPTRRYPRIRSQDQEVYLCSTAPCRWRLGIAHRRSQFCIWNDDELRCASPAGCE
ncbi:hypothetical protein VTN31DRAFT_4428 [Thermomyces dupontii]|uniref:uncharacterized protein n=1 Tax=Talaromyces thermophilus TaxID=28565 RepID=UPI0037427CEF